MVIHKPHKVLRGDSAILSAKIEFDNSIQELWFGTSKDYYDYLVTENVDAFLVGLLLLAMQKGEDIEIKAPVSARLYYQLKHYMIPALSKVFPSWKKINIIANEINENNLCTENASATGITAGVDSFAAVCEHYNEIGDFKLKYLTFFNAGSHGDFGGDKSRELFFDRLEFVKPIGEKLNLPIIYIDSNISEILGMEFVKTHTFRTIACALTLQKLIKFYQHASSDRLDFYILLDSYSSNYDLLTLPMLSTESTTFYNSNSQYNRVEKTRLIAGFPYTYDYLNVCLASNDTGKVDNCSECEKCLRTQLTLDLLGKLHLYKNSFDMQKYQVKKNEYIAHVILYELESEPYQILQLINEVNFKIPLESKILFAYKFLKKFLKKILKRQS